MTADWSLLDTAPPVAPLVGPFVRGPFLSLLERHVAVVGTEQLIVGTTAGAVAFEISDGDLGLCGPQNLVDYRSPIGDASEVLVETFTRLESGTTIKLDSLPQQACDVFVAALNSVGIGANIKEHESCAVLGLPPTFDDYMDAIGKKERHEIRRKVRRLAEELGEVTVDTVEESGPALVDFFEFHRRAAGDKATFMTSKMMAFFTDLLMLPGWQLDTLRGGHGQAVAAAISFVDDQGCYVYNSSYDPGLHRLAPGLVLLHRMVERSIRNGHRVFDFLKGDETYKYRMGAQPRQLFGIEVVT